MPENSSSSNGGYTYKSSGTNSQVCTIHDACTSFSSDLNKVPFARRWDMPMATHLWPLVKPAMSSIQAEIPIRCTGPLPCCILLVPRHAFVDMLTRRPFMGNDELTAWSTMCIHHSRAYCWPNLGKPLLCSWLWLFRCQLQFLPLLQHVSQSFCHLEHTRDQYWQCYLGSNGSYYYSNANGSTYYNNGRGGSTYTPPSGKK